MNRQIRLLLAWLEENEAIISLLGRLPEPGENTTAHAIRGAEARHSLSMRLPYASPTPALGVLPAALQEQGALFCRRPDVVAAMQGLDWTLGMVDLREILGFQKMIVQEQAVERANAVDLANPQSLFSFCLPETTSLTTLTGAIDQDQKGITFSSLNPNLRIGNCLGTDVEFAAVPGAPGRKEKFIGFAINFGVTFVQIAEYGGRWFVRDGYHRTYGLLRRGVYSIPSIFVRARNFQELGAAAAGFLPYEILFGERPPLLTDFLDDAVSVSTNQKATRKVVRITAEEFVVEV